MICNSPSQTHQTNGKQFSYSRHDTGISSVEIGRLKYGLMAS